MVSGSYFNSILPHHYFFFNHTFFTLIIKMAGYGDLAEESQLITQPPQTRLLLVEAGEGV